MRCAVMGAGSWGTAFALVAADAGNEVVMWSRDADVAEAIDARHENPRYHPGLVLPDGVRATTDPSKALVGAELVVLAVPAQTLRDNLGAGAGDVPDGSILVSLMKGVEHGTTYRMSEVIAEVAGVGPERVAVVSGPNLAGEIAQKQPTATTVASVDERVAQALVQGLANPYFRPYWTTDVIGTELGGAVKNVIALANGIIVGLGFGENTQSSLITRGLAEVTRLGVALGADPMTFVGLAGVGDLIATCTSPLSRNRSFGVLLGKGHSTEEATQLSTQTSEGVKSCRPIVELAHAHDAEMPIAAEGVRVVHEGADPRQSPAKLMTRATKAETYHA